MITERVAYDAEEQRRDGMQLHPIHVNLALLGEPERIGYNVYFV